MPKRASLALALASTGTKDAALLAAADLLLQRSDEILEANAADVGRAQAGGVASDSRRQAAPVSDAGSASMADGLRQVAALADPVGEVIEGWVRPNGLRIEKVRVPLGVVAIIYENRPNVTSDAAALCLKSGNAAFLRGSSAALASNQAIAAAFAKASPRLGCPRTRSSWWRTRATSQPGSSCGCGESIDCLIPRGGPSLIHAVLENATVPYVIDGDGNCHLYVDASADLEMALSLLVNGKTQRPSVCNATESLVVHRDVARGVLARRGRSARECTPCR